MRQVYQWVIIHRYSTKLKDIETETEDPATIDIKDTPIHQESSQIQPKAETIGSEKETSISPQKEEPMTSSQGKKEDGLKKTEENPGDINKKRTPPSDAKSSSSKDNEEAINETSSPKDNGEKANETSSSKDKEETIKNEAHSPTVEDKNKKEVLESKEPPFEVTDEPTISSQSKKLTKKVLKKEQVKQTQPEDEEKVIMERALEIRKNSFLKAKWDGNKTIGVWAPLNRIGVTTFIMNYSIFLGKERIPTVVLEALNKNHILKTTLKRYSDIPKGWNSYAAALNKKEISADSVSWSYNGVQWLPLDDQDTAYEWTYETLYHYINNIKYYDVVIVDLPTGKMESYTEHALEHLDQLWIIVDDAFQQNLAWKKYIHTLIEKYGLTCYLIFNKKLPFSQDQRLASELEIPLLASLPCMHFEVHKNYYEKAPIIEQPTVYQQLKEPFLTISKQLLGESFDIKEKGLIQKIRSILPRTPLRGKKKHDMI
ncbi:hypothetical protein [Neobacillus endophyticus]|uniref:hypothetical protein n=1 Tax=Neobacillus endophyticus TaxID=2738405 RepID=UPI001C265008|nr:hypothetical protein [Neobacillus endophyticus]